MNRFFSILLLFTACVEPYDFNRNNFDPQLIIEAFISDLSYNESLLSPSNGRYFIVKLKFTGPVDQFNQQRITPFAEVKIIDDLENEWLYYENTKEWGTYFLADKDFKACNDRMYKLQITTHDQLISGGEFVYESDWEQLPSSAPNPVKDIWFKEDIRKTYYYPADERDIRDEKVINVSTTIPNNSDGQVKYYKWEYSPMWVYEAPLATGAIYSPYKTCWITNPSYLNDYALAEDMLGGGEKMLFTLDVIENRRLFENFSVLIFQQRISNGYYNFCALVKEQAKSKELFDAPSANLPSNFSCINDPSKTPVGYFGIGNESARRWYFKKEDLSYFVNDYLLKECLVKYNRPGDPPDPAPECFYCLANTDGNATLTKPSWWIGN